MSNLWGKRAGRRRREIAKSPENQNVLEQLLSLYAALFIEESVDSEALRCVEVQDLVGIGVVKGDAEAIVNAVHGQAERGPYPN